MQIERAPDSAKDRFREVLPDDPEVSVKAMFANLGAFVHGQMFAATFGEVIGVRLAPEDLATANTLPEAGPFGPSDRPMKGYVAFPADGDAEGLREWAARAFAHVASLPPKEKKPNRRR